LLPTTNAFLGEAADIVIINAKVYSLNWGDPSLDGTPSDDAPFKSGSWKPDANAIAINGNTISKVGDYQSIKQFIGQSTQVFDLNCPTVGRRCLGEQLPEPSNA